MTRAFLKAPDIAQQGESSGAATYGTGLGQDAAELGSASPTISAISAAISATVLTAVFRAILSTKDGDCFTAGNASIPGAPAA